MSENMKAALEAQLQTMETAESVSMDEVRKLVNAVRDLFEGNFSGPDVELFGELGELARYLNNAKKEMREMSPHDLSDKQIPDASDQLDAIVQTTEKATGNIMDACERIQSIHMQLKDRLISQDPPIDPDVMAGVDDAISEADDNVTAIFEACNFQDLTGQRIMKVVVALREVERQVLRMIVAFGIQKDSVDAETKMEMESNMQMLNGPQLPGKSLDQDDIDDILNKLL